MVLKAGLTFTLLEFSTYTQIKNLARILSIDYGQKRTGLAASDPLQMIANGITTIETKNLEAWIADYLSHESVETIVVGLPKQTNGTDSENMKRITPFVNRLRKLYPNLRIDMYDERFTSVLAHKAILDSGMHKMARRNKEIVDQISATIILQDYMEQKRMFKL